MCLMNRLVEPGEVSRLEMMAAVAKSAARIGADDGNPIRGYLSAADGRDMVASGVTVATVEALVKEAMHRSECFGAMVVYEEPGGRRVMITQMLPYD